MSTFCRATSLWLACLFFAAIALPGMAEEVPQLDARIELVGGAMSVSFTLTNKADTPVLLHRKKTPLDASVDTDMFDVVLTSGDTHQPIHYTGRVVKRGPPIVDDFIFLGPGESLSREFDIAEAYAVTEIGQYTIQYWHSVTVMRSLDFADGTKIVHLESNTITAEQNFTRSIRQRKVAGSTSDTCDATQVSTINAAYPEAVKMADNSVLALNSTAEPDRPNATRYTTWFGNYDSNRYSTVTSNFTRIKDALDTQDIKFVCGDSECDATTYAFVYPSEPHDIYVCGSFFSAPLIGTDSQAGTIIHELSHFTVIAGTDDRVYGQGPAKELAVSAPDDAIKVADNHEFFAENNPELSMGTPSGPAAITLALGATVTGTLEQGESDYYSVEGASDATLFNLTGDLDLSTNSGSLPTDSSFSCLSDNGGSADETCSNLSGLTYIRVFGYEAGSYSLTTSGTTPPVVDNPEAGTVTGTVTTSAGTPICAMVLVSGQYTFSCAGDGAFNLTDLPTEPDGTMKLQVYAEGFVPYTKVLNGPSEETVQLARSGVCPNYNEVVSPVVEPPSPGEMVTIRGSVLVEDSNQGICAMVLANGLYRFSCGGAGAYEFDVNLDSDGQVKIQVYAEGFAPYVVRVDRNSTTQTARLARVGDCL